ncbi:MAG: TolB family protein [Phycisphaerales bacterium JB059]
MDGKRLIGVSETLLISEFNHIWAVPLHGGEKIPLVADPGIDAAASVSLDGRWLAYTRIADGLFEIRAILFAPAWPEHLHDREWIGSEETGIEPHWSPEGDGIFFIEQKADLLAVAVDTTGETFVFASPRVVSIPMGCRPFLWFDAGACVRR